MCLWCGNVVPDGSNWQIFVYSFNIWINRNLGSEKPIREQHKNAEISTKMWSDFVALASFHWHCVMKESVVVVTMKIAISSLEKKHGYNWVSKDFAEEASFSIYASKQKFVKSSVLHFHDFSPPPLPWTEGQWCNSKCFSCFPYYYFSLIAF